MFRHFAAAAFVAVVTSLVLGGCGANATSAGSTTASPSGSPQTSAASEAASSAISAAVSGPIKIGFLAPMTGPLSLNGKDGLDGFNLYLKSINSTIAGRKLDVVTADSEGQAEAGLTKAKELVENDGVQLLMGITATPVSYAVAS
jgi:ABC-type branched-subunit amino acid transport system substrate-binding protein